MRIFYYENFEKQNTGEIEIVFKSILSRIIAFGENWRKGKKLLLNLNGHYFNFPNSFQIFQYQNSFSFDIYNIFRSEQSNRLRLQSGSFDSWFSSAVSLLEIASDLTNFLWTWLFSLHQFPTIFLPNLSIQVRMLFLPYIAK